MTMVTRLGAFILFGTMAVIQSLNLPDNIPMIEARPGQTVIITCNASGLETGLFFWYKMNRGYTIQTVAEGSFGNIKLGKDFPNSTIHIKNNGDMHSLIIRNVSKEDDGIYFCQAGTAYNMAFVNGTYVVVNDSQNKKFTYVNQTSDMNSVLLGTTVTLQCSLLSEKKERTNQCADEHHVFWFRAESESNPGFIYSDKKRCSKQAGQSCEYRLTKMIQKPSDTGTYYCAVVTCGEILFGKGTKVETRQELYLYTIALLGGLLAFSVLMNITLIFKRRKPRRLRKNYTAVTTATKLTELDADHHCNMQDGEEDGMNYVALNFSSRKPTRWKSKRETSDDCTYSNIKLSVKGSIHQ